MKNIIFPFISKNPKKLLQILKNVKDIYRAKIECIAKLQLLNTRVSNLGNKNLDEINEYVEQDLKTLLNCDKAQLFIFSKNKHSLYTFKRDETRSLIRIESTSPLILELINGQDIKQKKILHKGEEANKVLGAKLGFKIDNLISAKIMRDDKLQGKFKTPFKGINLF